MIQRLDLRNFRGFQKFSVEFTSPTVLVGANNAGKSTIIAALRLATAMLRQGKRVRASRPVRVKGDEIRVHPFTSEQFDLQDENLRFEFREVPTSFTVTFTNMCKLRALWPTANKPSYFYFESASGVTLEVSRAVQDSFPSVGTIPPLSPLDLREEKLSSNWVRQNLGTRLASRHFRNQLLALKNSGDWNAFVAFAAKWTSGLRLEPPRVQELDGESSIDVFFHEGRGPKEVAWVGDGVQIFLQLLLHLFRLRGTETIVLDEPEIYLHPDLQHRLLRVINEATAQPVIATHSPEIVGEVESDHIVLIEKTKDKSVQMAGSVEIDAMAQALGSGFNLRFVRALRTRVVLFVEGKDSVVLRNLAAIVGAHHVANEDGIVVTRLHGVGNWQMLKGLPYLTQSLFEGAVETFVILDRDLMSDSARLKRQKDLRAAGFRANVWALRELESYLISPTGIARAVKLEPSQIQSILHDELDILFPRIEDALIGDRMKDPDRDRRLDPTTIVQRAKQELRNTWTTIDSKLTFCPAKVLLNRVNQRTQAMNGKSVSPKALSRNLLLEEVPDEMCQTLMRIEELLATPPPLPWG